MNINVDNLISISEANQNFSRVARLVDERGAAIILSNNAPRYILMDYSILQQSNKIASDATVDSIVSQILQKHIKAFEVLAKCNDVTIIGVGKKEKSNGD